MHLCACVSEERGDGEGASSEVLIRVEHKILEQRTNEKNGVFAVVLPQFFFRPLTNLSTLIHFPLLEYPCPAPLSVCEFSSFRLPPTLVLILSPHRRHPL